MVGEVKGVELKRTNSSENSFKYLEIIQLDVWHKCHHLHSIKKFCHHFVISAAFYTRAYINVKTHSFHRNRSHGKGHIRFGISWLLFFVHHFVNTQPHARQTGIDFLWHGHFAKSKKPCMEWLYYPSRSHSHSFNSPPSFSHSSNCPNFSSILWLLRSILKRKYIIFGLSVSV